MKKSKSEYLQLQYDNREFKSSYNFIRRLTGINASHKLLLDVMCNDVYLNGQVTWSRFTYAKETGTTKATVTSHFKLFIETGILVPDFNNVKGTKHKYDLMFSNISKLSMKKQFPEKKLKVVLPVNQSGNTGNTTTDIADNTTTDITGNTDIIGITNNTYIGDSEESSPLGDSSSSNKKEPSAKQMEELMHELNKE